MTPNVRSPDRRGKRANPDPIRPGKGLKRTVHVTHTSSTYFTVESDTGHVLIRDLNQDKISIFLNRKSIASEKASLEIADTVLSLSFNSSKAS